MKKFLTFITLVFLLTNCYRVFAGNSSDNFRYKGNTQGINETNLLDELRVQFGGISVEHGGKIELCYNQNIPTEHLYIDYVSGFDAIIINQITLSNNTDFTFTPVEVYPALVELGVRDIHETIGIPTSGTVMVSTLVTFETDQGNFSFTIEIGNELVPPTYIISYGDPALANTKTLIPSGNIDVYTTFNEKMNSSFIPQLALQQKSGNVTAVNPTDMTNVSTDGQNTKWKYSWNVSSGKEGIMTPVITVAQDMCGNVVTNTGSTLTEIEVDGVKPTYKVWYEKDGVKITQTKTDKSYDIFVEFDEEIDKTEPPYLTLTDKLGAEVLLNAQMTYIDGKKWKYSYVGSTAPNDILTPNVTEALDFAGNENTNSGSTQTTINVVGIPKSKVEYFSDGKQITDFIFNSLTKMPVTMRVTFEFAPDAMAECGFYHYNFTTVYNKKVMQKTDDPKVFEHIINIDTVVSGLPITPLIYSDGYGSSIYPEYRQAVNIDNVQPTYKSSSKSPVINKDGSTDIYITPSEMFHTKSVLQVKLIPVSGDLDTIVLTDFSWIPCSTCPFFKKINGVEGNGVYNIVAYDAYDYAYNPILQESGIIGTLTIDNTAPVGELVKSENVKITDSLVIFFPDVLEDDADLSVWLYEKNFDKIKTQVDHLIAYPTDSTTVVYFKYRHDLACQTEYVIEIITDKLKDKAGNVIENKIYYFSTIARPEIPEIAEQPTSTDKARMCPGDYLICTNFNPANEYQWLMNQMYVPDSTSEHFAVYTEAYYKLLTKDTETGCEEYSYTVSPDLNPVEHIEIFAKESDALTILVVDNTSQNYSSYIWTYDGGKTLPSEIVNNRQFLTLPKEYADGLFEVNITTPFGCKVPEASYYLYTQKSGFEVYPTLNNGLFTIKSESETEGNLYIRIFDSNGIQAQNKVFENIGKSSELEVNCTDLKTGTYIIEVQKNNNKESFKIFVNK